MVELVLMEQLQQDWALHLPAVPVTENSCRVQECVKVTKEVKT